MITKEGLVQLGPEILAEALLSLRKRPERALRRYGEFLLGVLDTDPQRLASLIRKEISFIKRSSHFVEHKEVPSLLEQLEFIREHIVQHLAHKDLEEALELLQSLLALSEPTLGRILADNEDVVRFFREACEDWGQLASLEQARLYPWKEIIKAKILEDKFSVYDDVLFNFKSVLSDEDLADLRKDFEGFAQQAQGRYHKEKYLNSLKKIADVLDDVDLYQKYCEWDSEPSFADTLAIAQRMISHWRSEEALSWLARATKWADAENNLTYFTLKLQALELNGDYEAALQERKAWVTKTLDPSVYSDTLVHLPDEERENYRQGVLTLVFETQDVQKALTFLLDTQEFSSLRRYIREKEGQLGGSKTDLFRRASQEIQGEDPLAAIILLRHIVEPVLEASLSRDYDEAIEDLWTCQNLSRQVLNWENHPTQELFMKQLETRYRLKTKFWSKYKSLSLAKKRTEDGDEAHHEDDSWRAIA